MIKYHCLCCKEDKGEDDFYWRKNGKIHTPCKKCTAKIGKKYRIKNDIALKEKYKKNAENNRELLRKRYKKYKKEKPELSKAKNARYYQKHKEELLQKSRSYNQRDYVKEKRKIYVLGHRKEKRTYDKNRVANIDNGYVRGVIKVLAGMESKYISDDLVESKKLFIMIRRYKEGRLAENLKPTLINLLQKQIRGYENARINR